MMKSKIIYSLLCALCIVCAKAESRLDSSDELLLNASDIAKIASSAGKDLLDSRFATSSTSTQIVAISNFYNLTDFQIDTHSMALLILKNMKDSSKFTLSGAIAGDALDKDPLLDKIRAQRNELEYQEVIPKHSLLVPRYSLSARISAITKSKGNKNAIEYHFIFSIVDLVNGLVVWDYITDFEKSANAPLPFHQNTESKYGKACNANQALYNFSKKEVCEIAISEIWTGNFIEIPESRAKLITAYASKACKLDSALGCRALGVGYKFGVGNEPDSKRAMQNYVKSCKLGDGGGCYNVGIMYEKAQGVAQDFQKAQEFYRKSCDLHFSGGCEQLKSLESKNKKDELDDNAKSEESKCAKNIGESCSRMAFFYTHGLQGASKNQAKAIEYYEKGCKLDNADSCYQLALLFMVGQGVAKDFSKALEYALKSCDLGQYHSRFACLSVGNIYEMGSVLGAKPVKIDARKALLYYKKSCDMGAEQGCTSYTNLLESVQ